MNEQTFRLEWDVKNFSFLMRDVFCEITHPIFADFLDDDDYMAEIYPSPDPPEFENISLIFTKYDVTPVAMEISGSVQLIDEDGGLSREKALTTTSLINVFGVKNLVSRDELRSMYNRTNTLNIRYVLRKITFPRIKTLHVKAVENVHRICRNWKLVLGQVGVLQETLEVQGCASELDVSISFKKARSEEMIIEFTRRCGTAMEPLVMNALITVLDAQGKDSDIWKQDLHEFSKEEQVQVWRFPSFLKKSALKRQKNKYLKNNTLQLKCEISVSSRVSVPGVKMGYEPVEVQHNQEGTCVGFMDDILNMFNNRLFTDVQLRVSAETVAAHKMVLRSRSARFDEMLERMDDDFLDLTDVDVITLKRMVSYMYTDKMDDLDCDEMVDTYTASHIYKIESLRCKCSFDLQQHLNVKNVCRILGKAVDCCDYDLKNCAVGFIKRFWLIVCMSEEWKTLTKERQDLAQMIKEEI